MFKEQYLLELLSGHLTEKGYANILGSIASMVKRYQWQKSIVVSGSSCRDWCNEDIEELTHMYFEWIIVNDKLKYLNKVPYEYLSYYFTQMLVSFVANRIKEEQQKIGISFQKCQELVKSICDEDYELINWGGKKYVKSPNTSSDKINDDIENILKYMPHYPISENTHQFKPLVKMVVDDILMNADSYISIDNLCKVAFALLDQTKLDSTLSNDIEPDEIEDNSKYHNAIETILSGVSKIDAAIYIEYIFQDKGQVSLSDIAFKYGIPKSSIHKKIEDFKKKIFSSYLPENENDGIYFLQNLADRLDEISK